MRPESNNGGGLLSKFFPRTLKVSQVAPQVFLTASASVILVAVWQTRPFGNYSSIGAVLLVPAIALCAAAILAPSAEEIAPADKQHIRLFGALVATSVLYHCFASLSILAIEPGTRIDVYLFQHHSAAALLRGIDPYTLTTENIYGPRTPFYRQQILINNRAQIGLPYPPASLFFVLPAFLLGDIRYAYFAAVLLSSIILLKLRTNFATVGAACLLLLSPVTRYVELQSWTEPFVLLTLTCTVYAAIRKCWWLPIALGLFLASKQYSVIALPFTPFLLCERSWKPSLKLLLVSLGIALVVTLPMALWNVRGFWRDVIMFHFRQPFRNDALSLSNLLFPIPLAAVLALVVIAVILAVKVARPHPSMFTACYGLTFLTVCATTQAFCNYYFLIIHALLLSAATVGLPMTREHFSGIAGARVWPSNPAGRAADVFHLEQTKVTS